MNDSILYRWDVPEAGIPDHDRDPMADKLKIEIDKLLPKYNVNIKVDPVKIRMTSARDKQITNREYLSHSMGVGGHIIGFLKYVKGQEFQPILEYTLFHRSIDSFRKPGRYLFIIPGSSITNIRDRMYDVTDASLDNTIVTCDGIIKVSQLGSLMPSGSANTAEINFVGNGVSIDAFMITFGDEDNAKKVAEEESTKVPKTLSDDEDEEEEEEEEEKPKSDPFIRRRGGGPGKLYRTEAGIPPDFYKVLDDIWEKDRVSADLTLPTIGAAVCPGAGSGGRKKKTRKRSRRTVHSKTKKSQKRRLNPK